MPIVVKQRSEFEWDIVEEKGVRERVLETHPLEEVAVKRVQELNAKRAQEVIGTFGTFRQGVAGRAADGCNCAGGMKLEAIPCPVHDV